VATGGVGGANGCAGCYIRPVGHLLGMSEYERSHTMPALPEIVFDEASDLDRGLDSWLPRLLRVPPARPPSGAVRACRPGQDVEAVMRTENDRLRMEWGTGEQGRYAGWLQVAAIGSGASEVTIHLSFLDESQAPADHAVEQALQASLRRLRELVGARVGGAG
jgi:hypothetical protein